jgi:hypothetical protein
MNHNCVILMVTTGCLLSHVNGNYRVSVELC